MGVVGGLKNKPERLSPYFYLRFAEDAIQKINQ
jgi:hypothetical protein